MAQDNGYTTALLHVVHPDAIDPGMVMRPVHGLLQVVTALVVEHKVQTLGFLVGIHA